MLHFQLCSAHYIALQTRTRSSTINQSQWKTRTIPVKSREAITWHYGALTPCTVSKDKWDTKEDTGKSIKHALYVMRYAKKHQSDNEQ